MATAVCVNFVANVLRKTVKLEIFVNDLFQEFHQKNMIAAKVISTIPQCLI